MELNLEDFLESFRIKSELLKEHLDLDEPKFLMFLSLFFFLSFRKCADIFEVEIALTLNKFLIFCRF
jgi:hypothetical protein